MKYYKVITSVTKKKAIKYYIDGMSTIKIAHMFHVDKKTILNWLNTEGVKRRTSKEAIRRFAIDSKFFDNIDNEYKAYWLGFLLSDGNIGVAGRNSKARTLRCALQWRDRNHLQKLLKNLSSKHKISSRYSNGHRAAWLVIATIDICTALERHGWSAFKNFGDVKILNSVPKELQRHLVRGMIDADGTLGIYDDKLRFGFVDLHESVVRWVQSWFIDNLGFAHNKIGHPSAAYTFHYGGIQVAKLAKLVYSDSVVSLDRKRIIAEKMMNSQA